MLRYSKECESTLLTDVYDVEFETHKSALLTSALSITNGRSLPNEILSIIVEDFIECAESDAEGGIFIRYIPRWYLIPLLRLSKQWNAVTVKYLYKTIAIGSHAPFQFPPRSDKKVDYGWCKECGIPAIQKVRKGHEVAEDLYRTLSANSTLSTLVTKLQLGVETVYQQHIRESCEESSWLITRLPKPQLDPDWTLTLIQILQLCPNVEHVDIRGFHRTKLDAAVEELRKKSLVCFSASAHTLLGDKREKGRGSFLQILRMMLKWPKLQSIKVEDFLDAKMTESLVTLDASQFSDCCPDLQDVIITGAALRPDMYKALRVIRSSGVTKLSVSLHGRQAGESGDAAVDALCECLRVWSATLICFKVDIMHHDERDSYQPMNETIRTLYELRELQFDRMKLDFGAVAKLPLLKRFACLSYLSLSGEEVQFLSSQLEDLETFPSLSHVVLNFGVDRELQELLRRRNIQVHEHWFGGRLSKDFLL